MSNSQPTSDASTPSIADTTPPSMKDDFAMKDSPGSAAHSNTASKEADLSQVVSQESNRAQNLAGVRVEDTIEPISGNVAGEGELERDASSREFQEPPRTRRGAGYVRGAAKKYSGVLKNMVGKILGRDRLKREGVASQVQGEAEVREAMR